MYLYTYVVTYEFLTDFKDFDATNFLCNPPSSFPLSYSDGIPIDVPSVSFTSSFSSFCSPS